MMMCLVLAFAGCGEKDADDDSDKERVEESDDNDKDDDDEDSDKEDDAEKEEDADGDDAEVTPEPEATPDVSDADTEDALDASLLASYNWQGTEDGSLLVFEEDGTFRYYQSVEDLTDYYFEGTYVFQTGKEAVTYLTSDLSEYGVTEEEITTIFENSDEYDESNFIVYVLNNEACIMDGENTVDTPYQTPYMGFCIEHEGDLYLDIANMNSANYHLYIAK